jgi:hypothetical protein
MLLLQMHVRSLDPIRLLESMNTGYFGNKVGYWDYFLNYIYIYVYVYIYELNSYGNHKYTIATALSTN